MADRNHGKSRGAGAEDESILSLSVGQFIYYLAFALYATNAFLDRTNFEAVLFMDIETFGTLIDAIVLLLLLTKVIVSQRATFWQWVVAVLLVALGFITWRQSGAGWLFWTALFIVCGQGARIKHLATVSFCVSASLFVLTVVCASLDVIDSVYTSRSGSQNVRASMGFTHPNQFGLALLEICLSFCIMRFGKAPNFEFVLISASAYACIAVADSRTSFALLCFLAFLITVFYLSKDSGLRTIETIVMFVVVLLLIAFSVYSMVVYSGSNPILSALNTLLSNRLYLANMYYLRDSLTLFGRDYSNSTSLVYSGGVYYTFLVDNAYCHIFLRFGIVAFAVFVLGIVIFYVDALKNCRWDACLLGLTALLVFSFTEHRGLIFADNYFLIGLTGILYGERASMWPKRRKTDASSELTCTSSFARRAAHGNYLFKVKALSCAKGLSRSGFLLPEDKDLLGSSLVSTVDGRKESCSLFHEFQAGYSWGQSTVRACPTQ